MNPDTEKNVSFYEKFAPYYSAVYGFLDADATVEQWLQLFESEGLIPSRPQRLRVPLRLLDAGCGPGWFLAAWCVAGFEVAGIDASPAMLRLADEEWRRRSSSVVPPLVQADLCDPASSTDLRNCFDLVVCHSHVPNLIHPADLSSLVESLTTYLLPGGVLAFDHSRIVSTTPAGTEEHPLTSTTSLIRTSRYDPANRCCDQRWQGEAFTGRETYYFHEPQDIDRIAAHYGARLWRRMEWVPNQPKRPFLPIEPSSERLVSIYRRV